MADVTSEGRDFPIFINQGPGVAWSRKNSSLIFKIGNTELEKVNTCSLFYFKIIQKHGKLHFRTIKNILNIESKNIHENQPETWM